MYNIPERSKINYTQLQHLFIYLNHESTNISLIIGIIGIIALALALLGLRFGKSLLPDRASSFLVEV